MNKNKNVYNVKKTQLICPNCKYEFPYNKNALDKKINKLGQLIHEKANLIKKIKKIPDDIRNDRELQRLIDEKNNYELMVFDLKQKRENLKQQEDIINYENLKMIIKEFYGKKEYLRCIDEMIRRSEAYEIKETMRLNYYSSSSGISIRKVS